MVAARKQLVRRSHLRRSSYDEADAVRLLRPKGEEWRKFKLNVFLIIHFDILHGLFRPLDDPRSEIAVAASWQAVRHT